MESTKNPSFSKKEAINFGFKTAKENIIFFLGLFVILILISIFSTAVQGALNANRQYFISLVFNIFMWVVNSIVSLGTVAIMLKFVDGLKPDYKDLYHPEKVFNYILASLIKALIVVVGFILLIIPGIIFAIKLQYVEYFIVDKKLDATEAIKASWELTKGVKLNLFLLSLLLGLINVLGILCLIIGLIITVPLSMVANAYVFRKLLNQSTLK